MPVTKIKTKWSSGNLVITDASGNTLATLDATNLAFSLGSGAAIVPPFVTAAADGAVTAKQGFVLVTKAGVCAMTIADPTATTDDGKELAVISVTANAHTLDNSAGSGFNAGGAASDVGTYGGAKGDNIVLVAYQGKWYVKSKLNVTLA